MTGGGGTRRRRSASGCVAGSLGTWRDRCRGGRSAACARTRCRSAPWPPERRPPRPARHRRDHRRGLHLRTRRARSRTPSRGVSKPPGESACGRGSCSWTWGQREQLPCLEHVGLERGPTARRLTGGRDLIASATIAVGRGARRANGQCRDHVDHCSERRARPESASRDGKALLALRRRRLVAPAPVGAPGRARSDLVLGSVCTCRGAARRRATRGSIRRVRGLRAQYFRYVKRYLLEMRWPCSRSKSSSGCFESLARTSHVLVLLRAYLKT